MSKKNKIIPNFLSEEEEKKFWESHDSTEYVDWSKSKSVVFPYQSLMKTYLADKVQEELFHNKTKS